MAYNGPSNYKDNFGRWQSKATINLTKMLMKRAEEIQADVGQDIVEQLEKVHKANVVASYYPRSKSEKAKAEFNRVKKAEEQKDWEKHQIKHRLSRKTLSYEHTGTLEGAIYAEFEKKSLYEGRAVVKVRPDPYEQDHPRTDGKLVTAVDVYQWLREGTNGGNSYWFTNENGERPTAYNYPTPAHLFELHTQLQMKGYIQSLNIKKIAKQSKKGGSK